jgi:hypothetical protein
MSIVEYRTTHWMPGAHPEARAYTTAEFIDYYNKGNKIKYIQLYPDDLVIVAIGKQIMMFYSAYLPLYKHLWDYVDDVGKGLLRKHFKRCVNIREQVKFRLIPEEILTWYMAILLGANDYDIDNNQ